MKRSTLLRTLGLLTLCWGLLGLAGLRMADGLLADVLFQDDDVPAGNLSPRQGPYRFFFQNEAYIAPWEPNDAENWVFENGYVQQAEDSVNYFSYYEGQIDGDYEFSVELNYEAGIMGGGLIFNAANKDTINGAMLFAYSPSMPDGSLVHWGSFDQSGAFNLLGDYVAIPPANDGVPRTLIVRVRSNTYSLAIEQPGAAPLELLPETILPGGRVAQPYVGLYATQSRVKFTQADIGVTNRTDPTATPAPATDTPTPPPFETPPTITPTPTLTITPDVTPPGDVLPGNGRSFTFANLTNAEQDEWLVSRQGNWQFTSDGFVQEDAGFSNAFTFYEYLLFGDYEISVDFRYLDGDNGGGVIFNAPTRSLRDAYVVAFRQLDDTPDLTNLFWGYFEENDDDELELVRVSQSGARTNINDGLIRNLNIRVSGNSFTISLTQPVTAGSDQTQTNVWASNVTFPTKRVFQPYLGLYTHRSASVFESATFSVQPYAATPTPAPTAIGQPTAIGTRSTTTPTPTPTWTPSSPTPTVTPTPGTPTPSPTTVPVMILTPVTSTPTSPPVISQPGPEQDPPTLLEQTATAQAIAAGAFNATATAQMIFDAQTATALAAPPTATPDIGVANPGLQPQPTSPLPPAVDSVALADATATNATDGDETFIVVTSTPSPTQRAIESPTPTPTSLPSQLALFGRIWQSTVRAAFLLWFIVGSIIFFAAAGIVAGLSMRQEPDDPFTLFDAEDDLLPPIMPPAADGDDRLDDRPDADDNWPSSLP